MTKLMPIKWEENCHRLRAILSRGRVHSPFAFLTFEFAEIHALMDASADTLGYKMEAAHLARQNTKVEDPGSLTLYQTALHWLSCMREKFYLKFLSCRCYFILFFDCIHAMWKFLSQALNSCHSCNLCHLRANTRSLTYRNTQKLPWGLFRDFIFIFTNTLSKPNLLHVMLFVNRKATYLLI